MIVSHPFGKEEQGFIESSLPNFFGSGYSTCKRFYGSFNADVRGKDFKSCAYRMPIVGEDNPRNFITKITTYEKICSIPNSMTVLPELLPLVVDMMMNGVVGTLNLTNPGLISHNEMLQMYKELVDPDFTWQNFTVEEQAKILGFGYRSNNFLDTSRLESLYKVKHIKESVRDILTNYKRDPTRKQIQTTDFPNRPNTVLLVTGWLWIHWFKLYKFDYGEI